MTIEKAASQLGTEYSQQLAVEGEHLLSAAWKNNLEARITSVYIEVQSKISISLALAIEEVTSQLGTEYS